jgi:hypothetical protein
MVQDSPQVYLRGSVGRIADSFRWAVLTPARRNCYIK